MRVGSPWSDQAFVLEDLFVLVEGSFGKAAHLDDVLVGLIRVLLDERQDAVLNSQFTHGV